MVIGFGIISIRIHESHSLKEKRKVVKSFSNKIKNKFNVSIGEVGANDLHQRAEIGFSIVGNEKGFVNSSIDKLFNFAENLGIAEVIDSNFEMINY